MMHLHITNKLQQKLHVPLATAFPGADVGCLQWYANLFRANRAQYILTTHAASLYSVVLQGRGITDGASYLQALGPALERQLALDGLEQVYVHHIAPAIDRAVFVKTSDRSVLGSMNDMVRLMTLRLERYNPETALIQLGADLNNIPFKAIDFQNPKHVIVQQYANEELKE